MANSKTARQPEGDSMHGGFNADTMGMHMGAGPQIPSLQRLRRPSLYGNNSSATSTATVDTVLTTNSSAPLVGRPNESAVDLTLLSETQTLAQQIEASKRSADKTKFKKLSAYVGKKKAWQHANDSNIVARLANRRVRDRDELITELRNTQNQPIKNFPKTAREVDYLNEEELNALLTELKLVALRPAAIDINGDKEAKRVTFNVQIGLNPGVGRYLPVWQGRIELFGVKGFVEKGL